MIFVGILLCFVNEIFLNKEQAGHSTRMQTSGARLYSFLRVYLSSKLSRFENVNQLVDSKTTYEY